MIKSKIIFFGDSIIKFKNCEWPKKLINLINNNFKDKFNYKTFSVVGLNSRTALEKLPKILLREKNINMILIQIGINDSWHYKSLKGIPNVSKESFKANLDEIYFKCKKFGVRKIFFLTYHRLAKNRFEINKKNINQNLKMYINIIKKFCKNKNIQCIDIFSKTKKISSKKICLPLPDGVHLNNFGTGIYSEIIYKYLKKLL
jgi:lysophospholipase L1-like esterase